MFKLIFRSPWPVPAVLALLCFLAAGWFYDRAVKDQAEAAIALQQGVPAAVSLNTFDPAKDIHPADEVNVIGWVNTDHNYQLTETSRKRADVVRRMFVLFGPDDAADSKQVRAVVLMPDGDVERFVTGITEHLTAPYDERLMFSLNGTAERSPTLNNMANDALAEKGLTKAPGFRFIEIWPADGRAAALAPDPTMPLFGAAFGGVPGLILLLVAFFKFSRRNRVVKPNPAAIAEAVAHAAMMRKMQESQAQSFASFATGTATASAKPAQNDPHMPSPWPAQTPAHAAVSPGVDAALVPAAKRSLMPAPHSIAFLALAIFIGAASTWTGHWQLMVLAVGMGIGHFVARVKRAMDKGVEAVASAINQVKGMSRPAQSVAFGASAAPGTAPVARVPTPVERIMALGQTTLGRKVAQVAIVVAMLLVAPFVLNDTVFAKLGLPTPGTVLQGNTQPQTEPSKVEQAPESASLPVEKAAPAALPVAPSQSGPISPLIPAEASLRPAEGQTGAPAVVQPVEVAMARTVEPAVEPAVKPEATVAASEPVVTNDASVLTEATAPVAPPVTETAAMPADVAEPAKKDDAAAKGAIFAGFDLSGLGSLLVLGPIAGAVLLAIAAFALMRGRQAAPPHVFAGKDPWGRLARDARGKA